MSGLERVKAEMMLFAINNDYFGYGSIIKKQNNGTYKASVEGETYTLSLKQLAKDWDNLEQLERQSIAEDYINSELLKDN